MKKSAHLALGLFAGLAIGGGIVALARPKPAQDPVKAKPDSYNVFLENAKAGDHGWREPVTHQAQNVGDNEIRALIVEPRPCKY